MFVRLTCDLILWCELLFRPRDSLEAEILFLRRQLALYRERGGMLPSSCRPSVAVIHKAPDRYSLVFVRQ